MMAQCLSSSFDFWKALSVSYRTQLVDTVLRPVLFTIMVQNPVFE